MAKSTQPATAAGTGKSTKKVQCDGQGRPVTVLADPAVFGGRRSR